MKKVRKIVLTMTMVFSTMFWCAQPVWAAQGTEGAEMQVVQAEKMEIQLGTDWAGVEFQLKTDAGLYPGTIPVGEDGVLRLEIGGSSSYILTCMNSVVAVPDTTQAFATTESSQKEIKNQSEQQDTVENKDIEPDTDQEMVEDNANTIAGIPLLHLVVFAGGMVVAIGSLIGMQIVKRRKNMEVDDEEGEDE